jgi:hypothetical protein
MQNQDQDIQRPVIDQPGQRASEIQIGALAAAGRRRTQEQGQSDLNDDWQDTTPSAAPEQAPSSGQSRPDR